MHAHLIRSGRAEALSVTDADALDAARLVARTEGIIPALETAHAFAALNQLRYEPTDVIVICLSGRGDKDLEAYMRFLDEQAL